MAFDPRDPFSISIVIVNWNGRDITSACLRSLEAQTYRDVEIIVVDNGSADDSVGVLRRDFPWVHLVEAGENLGFAEGVNRGLAVARGAWIATLNNDTVADARWLEELRAAAKQGDFKLGMVQSCVVFQHAPDRTNSTGVLLFDNGGARDRDFDEPLQPGFQGEEVFCPTAGAALYRRAMLDAIALPTGVFDRTFFMYFEDVDLGWRCRLAGWSATYAPRAIVRHAFQASSKKQAGRFIGLHLKRNRVRMLLKNGSLAMLARTLPRTVFEVAEAVVWQGPSILRSFVEAARDGALQRGEVNKRALETRGVVESRWLSPSPKDQSLASEAVDAIASIGRVWKRRQTT
jgi:hypothetical protein